MISQPQTMQQSQQAQAASQEPWASKSNIDNYYSEEPAF